MHWPTIALLKNLLAYYFYYYFIIVQIYIYQYPICYNANLLDIFPLKSRSLFKSFIIISQSL